MDEEGAVCVMHRMVPCAGSPAPQCDVQSAFPQSLRQVDPDSDSVALDANRLRYLTRPVPCQAILVKRGSACLSIDEMSLFKLKRKKGVSWDVVCSQAC